MWCRNCFWDRYWCLVGQLLANFFPLSLVTVPEVFGKLARPSLLAVSKAANSTALSRLSLSCVAIVCMLKLETK